MPSTVLPHGIRQVRAQQQAHPSRVLDNNTAHVNYAITARSRDNTPWMVHEHPRNKYGNQSHSPYSDRTVLMKLRAQRVHITLQRGNLILESAFDIESSFRSKQSSKIRQILYGTPRI
jgi:hypothetical protein